MQTLSKNEIKGKFNMKKNKKIIIIVSIFIIIAIIMILLIYNNKKNSKEYSNFILDSNSKYILTTNAKILTMQDDGGSYMNDYYQIDFDNNQVTKCQDKYVGFNGYEYKEKILYTKELNENELNELKSLIDETIEKKDDDQDTSISNYYYTLSDKDYGEIRIYDESIINKLESLLSLNQENDEEDENTSNDNIQELTSFDITATSYLNSMPSWTKDDNPREAYFLFNLVGINKDTFLSEYEIESIDINGNTINNEDIIYNNDDNGFRFYSSQYKDNNSINLIIKNKKTNIKYSKILQVSTETVY